MCLTGPSLAIFLKQDWKVSLKKVQDPLKFSWLVACSPSEPWQPGILLCWCWQQIQGTASPAAVGSLSGTKPRLEHEAAFLPQCSQMHFICGFLGECTLCQAGLMQAAQHGAQELLLLPRALPSGAKVLPQHFCTQLASALADLQLQPPSFSRRGS